MLPRMCWSWKIRRKIHRADLITEIINLTTVSARVTKNLFIKSVDATRVSFFPLSVIFNHVKVFSCDLQEKLVVV